MQAQGYANPLPWRIDACLRWVIARLSGSRVGVNLALRRQDPPRGFATVFTVLEGEILDREDRASRGRAWGKPTADSGEVSEENGGGRS